jgi:hypothetical protein
MVRFFKFISRNLQNSKNLQKFSAFQKLLLTLSKGNPDVALFNFTNRHMADEASILVPFQTSSGSPLLVSLVGDALLQPFWPLGTGVNRAILSGLDTAWMLKEIKLGRSLLPKVASPLLPPFRVCVFPALALRLKINSILLLPYTHSRSGVPFTDAVQNRNKSYLLMKNCLAGSIKPPFAKVTADPLTRYGGGWTS